tara:strand:- start:195 stop:383 length:189 start_codon:yes stop_codon:yes gene_type:complete
MKQPNPTREKLWIIFCNPLWGIWTVDHFLHLQNKKKRQLIFQSYFANFKNFKIKINRIQDLL